MAKQPFDVLPYISALRKIIKAMPMPAQDKDVILQGLERHRVHVSNKKQYARLQPRTPEQRAKAAAATARWRAINSAAAEKLAHR